MSIEHVTVPRIRCERVDEHAGRCTSRVYGDDTVLSDDRVRTLARERGVGHRRAGLVPEPREGEDQRMTVAKLLTAARDWWHRPVTERLDALIVKGTKREKVPDQPWPDMTARGHWSSTMPRN